MIVIFAFSILFAYLINPIVRFLQRYSLFFKNLRGPHAEAYLALLILVGLVVHGLDPQFAPRAGRLMREWPTMIENVYSGDVVIDMGHRNGWDEAQSLRAKAFLQQRRETIRALVESIRQFASVVFGGILLIPILGLFFLSDGEKLANGIIQLVSTKGTYEEARALAADLNDMLRHYIRAKVILAVLSVVYGSTAMLFLRYPHAIALGLLAGVLEFIPVAGWITALATIAMVGLATHSHWIWMALLLGLWRMIMDYGIAPRVMGHELEIHPLLHLHAHGRRSGRRNRGHLSLRAHRRRLARGLAPVLLATAGEARRDSARKGPDRRGQRLGSSCKELANQFSRRELDANPAHLTVICARRDGQLRSPRKDTRPRGHGLLFGVLTAMIFALIQRLVEARLEDLKD